MLAAEKCSSDNLMTPNFYSEINADILLFKCGFYCIQFTMVNKLLSRVFTECTLEAFLGNTCLVTWTIVYLLNLFNGTFNTYKHC